MKTELIGHTHFCIWLPQLHILFANSFMFVYSCSSFFSIVQKITVLYKYTTIYVSSYWQICGLFQSHAVLKSTTINIWCISFAAQIYEFRFIAYLGIDFKEQRLCTHSVSVRASKCLFHVDVPVHTLTSSVQKFMLLCIFNNTW